MKFYITISSLQGTQKKSSIARGDIENKFYCSNSCSDSRKMHYPKESLYDIILVYGCIYFIQYLKFNFILQNLHYRGAENKFYCKIGRSKQVLLLQLMFQFEKNALPEGALLWKSHKLRYLALLIRRQTRTKTFLQYIYLIRSIL